MKSATTSVFVGCRNGGISEMEIIFILVALYATAVGVMEVTQTWNI